MAQLDTDKKGIGKELHRSAPQRIGTAKLCEGKEELIGALEWHGDELHGEGIALNSLEKRWKGTAMPCNCVEWPIYDTKSIGSARTGIGKATNGNGVAPKSEERQRNRMAETCSGKAQVRYETNRLFKGD